MNNFNVWYYDESKGLAIVGTTPPSLKVGKDKCMVPPGSFAHLNSHICII